MNVLVGSQEDGDADSRQFRMPVDLLWWRSTTFQVMLDGRFLESAIGLIKLPETSIATFQNFFIWAFCSAPHIDPALSLEAVVDLAIFATVYQVFALQNQATDVIRAKLGSGDWQLEPDVVGRVYQDVGEMSVLRQVITAALGTIDKPLNAFSVGKKTKARKTAAQIVSSYWEVFRKEADLGADFFAGTLNKWEGSDLGEGGACRFHDHGGRVMADKTTIEGVKCPFQATECFEDVAQVAQQEAEVRKKEKKKRKMAAKARVDVLPEQAANSVEEPATEAAVEVEEPAMEVAAEVDRDDLSWS